MSWIGPVISTVTKRVYDHGKSPSLPPSPSSSDRFLPYLRLSITGSSLEGFTFETFGLIVICYEIIHSHFATSGLGEEEPMVWKR